MALAALVVVAGDTLLFTLDYNLPVHRDVRVLYTDSDPLKWDAGFWDTVRPTGAGTLHLAFSDRYERWYKLRVEVKAEDELGLEPHPDGLT